MESYIFEKGLLDTKSPVLGCNGELIARTDLELYFALEDKYNHTLITKVIDSCRDKLDKILSSPNELFEISVYFKLKDLEKGKEGHEDRLKFRPMHTARLTDMICMVSILQCLMFDDSSGKRKLSELSKLIPHNFYGNIPSTDVQYLFKGWRGQYKEYTDDVIEHCRSYQNSHRYLSEVCLDIKNFFPSVSPQFLYDYILEKLSVAFGEEDNKTLKMAVAKLLYFKIAKENINSWLEDYYGDNSIKKDDFFMNCGIPQGLPQSYFFGNLCMIEVKKLLMRSDLFKGDSYFYVDDSVIYVQSELNDDSFGNKLQLLNAELRNFCEKYNTSANAPTDIISKVYVDFQKNITYIIKFHEEGKSTYCHIDDADNYLDGFQNLNRQISGSSRLYENLEDIDDSISFKKLRKIKEVVENELGKLKEKSNLRDKEASRLKMLKRFKKFYLYRIQMLKLKTGEETVDNLWDEFCRTFLKDNDYEKWFERNEEDIFQSEYRLLIQKSGKEGSERKGRICEFEKEVLSHFKRGKGQQDSCFLYFTKDVNNSFLSKSINVDIYASLRRWMKEKYCDCENLPLKDQFRKFGDFLAKEFVSHLNQGIWGEEYSSFIAQNSSEYQRRVLNAFYSSSISVMCSDNQSFIKANSRKMHYSELRILARLRNRNFNKDEFCAFMKKMDDRDISNQMYIDIALLEVVGTFIRFVRNPEWIDGLILTHRITKGLWYNGSKFLNSYTLHNEEHAVTLIRQSVHIVRTIDYFAIKPVDYYILFLACYLHDISMVIHPDLYELGSLKEDSTNLVSEQMLRMQEAVGKFFKVDVGDRKNSRMKEAGTFLVQVFEAVYSYFEKQVRRQHPIDSSKFIRSKSDTLLRYLEPTLLSFVAKVSDSHGWNVDDVYGLKSRAKDDTVSLKYLMILLRLADLFDVANDRVNYYLLRQNNNFLPRVSKFHWISHLVTDKLELDADYDVDKEADLCEHPITETLIVRLYLNVKYLAASKSGKECKNCQSSLLGDHISIEIEGGKEYTCNGEQCNLLCRWMMKKHEMLIPELKALNDYLFSVNNSLIKTNIKLEIKFSDDMKLDADLFDSVVDYLQEEDSLK